MSALEDESSVTVPCNVVMDEDRELTTDFSAFEDESPVTAPCTSVTVEDSASTVDWFAFAPTSPWRLDTDAYRDSTAALSAFDVFRPSTTAVRLSTESRSALVSVSLFTVV